MKTHPSSAKKRDNYPNNTTSGPTGKSALCTGKTNLRIETEPRDLTLLVDATMQSCEPVSWGILHVAHGLTIPTARTLRLLDHVQFCLMPITNPDGVCEGRSVTNARAKCQNLN